MSTTTAGFDPIPTPDASTSSLLLDVAVAGLGFAAGVFANEQLGFTLTESVGVSAVVLGVCFAWLHWQEVTADDSLVLQRR